MKALIFENKTKWKPWFSKLKPNESFDFRNQTKWEPWFSKQKPNESLNLRNKNQMKALIFETQTKWELDFRNKNKMRASKFEIKTKWEQQHSKQKPLHNIFLYRKWDLFHGAYIQNTIIKTIFMYNTKNLDT